MIKEKIDSIVTKEMGHISIHTLRDNIVDVYLAKDGTVENNIKLLFDNKLELLKEPTKEKV